MGSNNFLRKIYYLEYIKWMYRMLDIVLVFQNINMVHCLDNTTWVGLYIETKYSVVTNP